MHRSPARAVARPDYLTLVPRDEIAAAVAETTAKIQPYLDAIGEPTPHDPSASPLHVGEWRTFPDPFTGGLRKGYVITLLGNQEIIVLIPARADGSASQDAISNLVDVVTRELEPGAIDD